jgi:hypothetical protein
MYMKPSKNGELITRILEDVGDQLSEEQRVIAQAYFDKVLEAAGEMPELFKINTIANAILEGLSQNRQTKPKDNEDNPEDNPEYRHPVLSKDKLEQDTFQEGKEFIRVLSHWADKAFWDPLKDRFGITHNEERSHIVTINGEDLPKWWDGATDNHSLLKEIQSYGQYAPKVGELSLALLTKGKEKIIDINLDDILDRIGLDSRSTQERIINRKNVWRILMILSVSRVTGKRPYVVYDAVTKKNHPLECDDPLVQISAWRKSRQELSRGEVPLRVSIYAGPFILRHLDNDQVLQYSPGAITQTMALPNMKTVPSWVHTMTRNFQQFCREHAVEIKYEWERHPEDNAGDRENGDRIAAFGPITRRMLLEEPTRSNPSIGSMLRDKRHRGRIFDYCEEAIASFIEGAFPGASPIVRKLIVREKNLAYRAYGGRDPLDWSAEARRARNQRQGWHDAYLDEDLEFCPVQDHVKALEAIKDAKPVRRRRRGRKRPE